MRAFPFLASRGGLGAVAAGVGAALLAGCILAWIDRGEQRGYEATVEDETTRVLTDEAGQIEHVLAARILLADGLAALVRTYPDIASESFEKYAESLSRGTAGLRSIALLPDGIIRYAYPLAGNEAAIGLNLRTMPGQNVAVERAIATRRPILAGPLKLVQGGRGLAMREAVFLPTSDGEDRFWGLVSVVVDFDAVMGAAEVREHRDDVDIAIRGADGLGADGAVFFGDPAIFASGGHVVDIRFPGGSWQIAGEPHDGWSVLRPRAWVRRAVGAAGAVLVGFGSWLMVAYHTNLRRANNATQRLNRSLLTLSRGIEAVAHAQSEDALLDRICRIMVETGGHHLAWIGRAEYDEARSVWPVAAAGDAVAYVKEVRSSWSDATDRGRGPNGTAIRTGRPVVIRRIEASSDMRPWQEAAKRYGFASHVSVPIRGEGSEPFGVMCVYSGETDAFDPAEQELLVRLADTLGHGIHALQSARDLVAAKEEAELANIAKSTFLATMSHELRTPLNAIIGFSEVMFAQTMGPLGNSRYLGYCQDIHQSGQHLLTIINDVLDLSRVEAGRMEVRREPVEVRSTVLSAITMVRERAENAGLVLTADIAPALPPLSADRRLLKQILLNLLSNAVKFTDRGGRVTVAVTRDGEDLEIRIADTGIGMSPEEIEVALTPFAQIDSKLARAYEGTGLGLPLAKSFVELHGGTLTVGSAPGVGTTVTVRFPGSLVDETIENSQAIAI